MMGCMELTRSKGLSSIVVFLDKIVFIQAHSQTETSLHFINDKSVIVKHTYDEIRNALGGQQTGERND